MLDQKIEDVSNFYSDYHQYNPNDDSIRYFFWFTFAAINASRFIKQIYYNSILYWIFKLTIFFIKTITTAI